MLYLVFVAVACLEDALGQSVQVAERIHHPDTLQEGGREEFEGFSVKTN